MRKYLWLIMRFGFSLIVNYFWVVKYSLNPKKYSFEKRYKRSRKLLTKLNKAVRADIIIKGAENLVHDDVLFITPNHLSNYDAISMIILMEQPTIFVAKKELGKFPYVGRIFKIIDGQLLDRNNLKQELQIMRHVKKSLEEKEAHWIIFPEGTRNRDYQNTDSLPFKHGTFRIPLQTNKAIVPIATYGSFRVLSTKHHLKKYPVHISVLPKIYPEQYQNMNSLELSQLVEKMIQEEVKILRIKDAEYIKNLRKKAKR